MFIFTFLEIFSIEYIFLRNSYIESEPKNSKMKGKSVKSFYSNIKVISKVFHIKNTLLSVLYNIMEIMKIISCPYLINLSNFNTKH